MDVINYILSKKLKKYVDDSVGNVPDEKITEVVNNYFDENPVVPGATSEQAYQIQDNTNKIAELKGDIGQLNHDVFGWTETETEQVLPQYYKIVFDEVWSTKTSAAALSASATEISLLDAEGNAETVSSVVGDSEYNSTYAASNLIDGDLTTMWSSANAEGVAHTLIITLKKPSIITNIGIIPRCDDLAFGVPNNMTIYASTDNIEWTEVAKITNQKDSWSEGTWRYFDLQPFSKINVTEHTIPSVREEMDTLRIFAETEPCETSATSELAGLINDKGNRLIIHGDDEAFGSVMISNCENLIPDKYTLNVTSSNGITFSSYYRYLIINGDGSGTGNAYTYITGNNEVLRPSQLKAGDTYKLLLFVNKELPKSDIKCWIDFRDESNIILATRVHYFSTVRQFIGVVPENAVKWRISFEGIARDQIWNDIRIYPALILNDSICVTLQDDNLLSDNLINLPLSSYGNISLIETFQYNHSYKYKIGTKTYIDNHTSNVDMNYTTPEDFGAVGDGIFDDTEAIQQCLQYGYDNCIPVKMYKSYLVSDSLRIQNDMDVYINRLAYTGTDSALILDCQRSIVDIRNLTSNAKGITLRADTVRVEHNLILIGNAYCGTHCITLEGTVKAIYQNKFEFRLLKAGGNGCYCISNVIISNASYVTENTYYGGQCENADWAYYGSGGNNKFYDIEVEGNIKGGFCFVGGANALIVGDRHAESERDGEYPFIKIKTVEYAHVNISGAITALRYISACGLRVNEIDVSEVTTMSINDGGYKSYIGSSGILGNIDVCIVSHTRTGTNEPAKYQRFANGAIIWCNVLIFQGVPFKYLIVTENLDLRTIGEYTPALPSVFEIGCENCEIHLHPTYCFMGINKFEIIQTETYQATIYDYYKNSVVFDGTQYGAGTFEVSTFLNGDYANIDGTNMIWKVRRIA